MLASHLKKIIKYFYLSILNKYAGFYIAIRGKFGIGGSVRKRKFFFRVGYGTGTSNFNNNFLIRKDQI
jgi:hypothetical protein